MTTTLTPAQFDALKWLRLRNGTGVFGKDGVLLAAGQRAPVMRSTWNRLRDSGFIEIDGRRATFTDAGWGKFA